MIWWVDTETDGLIPKGVSYRNLNRMPHLVQLSWVKTDNNLNQIEEVDLIIKPEDYQIPTSASDIHGVTQERAMEEGVPLKEAMKKAHSSLKDVDLICAFNAEFDTKILHAAFSRAGATNDHIFTRRHCCIMLAATPVTKIPSPYPGYRWPKLQYAHKEFFGHEFDGAHNSLEDIRATIRVAKYLIDKGHLKLQ